MRLIRDGEEGVWRLGKREIIYLSLHCHHQNDFCIKMGSDESHFNVSVGNDGQDSVHKPQPFSRERRTEAVSNRGPSAYQPNALPLGQTGLLPTVSAWTCVYINVYVHGFCGRKATLQPEGGLKRQQTSSSGQRFVMNPYIPI